MIKNYKKGDVLVIKYRKQNYKNILQCVGVVIEMSDRIVLSHNFSGKTPIDITKIPIKNIISGKKVNPKEINSLKDME